MKTVVEGPEIMTCSGMSRRRPHEKHHRASGTGKSMSDLKDFLGDISNEQIVQ